MSETPIPSTAGIRRMISRRKVCEMMSISDTTLWRLRRLPEFPRPVKINGASANGAVAFFEDEIADYQRSLRRVSTSPAAEAA